MIRYHTFKVDGAGTGAIDLVNGDTKFTLDVIPSITILPVGVSFTYDSAKAANAYDGGFTLDINGGEPHSSINTVENTTTITGQNDKQVKFTFTDSGDSKRLSSIEDFDGTLTTFAYPNNLLETVTCGDRVIKLIYDDSSLEILSPAQIGVEIVQIGNNFFVNEVSRRSGSKQPRYSTSIIRPAATNATSAVIADLKTGIRLERTFEINSDRSFTRETMFVNNVSEQVTVEYFTTKQNPREGNYYAISKHKEILYDATTYDSCDLRSIRDGSIFPRGSQWMYRVFSEEGRILEESHSGDYIRKEIAPDSKIMQRINKRYNYYNGKLASESTEVFEPDTPFTRIMTTWYYYQDDKLVRIQNSRGYITEIDNANGEETVTMWYSLNPSEKIIVKTQEPDIDTTGNLNYVAQTMESSFLKYLTSGTSQVEYGYDDIWGRRNLVKFGQLDNTTAYATYSYNDSLNQSSISYANGEMLHMQSDNFGKITSIKRETKPLLDYVYDDKGRLSHVFDSSGEAQTTSFQYDEYGNMTLIEQGDVTITPKLRMVAIDGEDREMDEITYQIRGKQASNYKYQINDNISTCVKTAKLSNITIEQTTFNAFGQLVQITNPLGNVSYIYGKESIGNNEYKILNNVKSVNDLTGTTEYLYDEKGNITLITKNNEEIARYQYDEYGRLKYENGKNYEYDTDGNLRSKSWMMSDGVVEDFFEYYYEYEKGRLINYLGYRFEYDSLGNPTLYKDKPMQWDFKNLKEYKDCNFTYDASGLRQTKIHGGFINKYYWAGDKLIAEKRTASHTRLVAERDENNVLVGGYLLQGGMHLYEDNIYLEYIHGLTGIIGFTLQRDNGVVTKYWYAKNLQGDVTHVYKQEENNTNILVAEYRYDAWGNQTIVTNVDDIANINPIRYRGYYYDTETGLYYLITRYYDSETGRFISMDSIDNIHIDEPNALNLYIYCGNNPVMWTDPTGEFFLRKAVEWVVNTFMDGISVIVDVAEIIINATIVKPIELIYDSAKFFYDKAMDFYVNDFVPWVDEEKWPKVSLMVLSKFSPVAKLLYFPILIRDIANWLRRQSKPFEFPDISRRPKQV